MKTAALVVNWVFLAMFSVAFLVLSLRYSGATGIGSLVTLIPYGSALLALNSSPHRGLIGISLFFNIFLVVAGAAFLLLTVIGRIEEPAKGVVGSLLLAGPPILNCTLLVKAWERARLFAKQR